MKVAKYYHSSKKRALDIVFSLLLIFLISPFAIIFLLYFKIFIGGPLIYKQLRNGKNKKIFTLYKIRTMNIGADKLQKKLQKLNQAPYPMFKIDNDPRFIAIGKKMSAFGLDEIPQLLNILKGEMSFVGPRPLPVDEGNLLDKTWDFRYMVKPGILSKWALSPDRHKSLSAWKKLELDDLKNGSLKTDIEIIFRAFSSVLVAKMIKNIFQKK